MKLKNNEIGSTFMLVIIGFAVLFIFSLASILISNLNMKQTIREDNRTQAYYLAKTGAETFINYIVNEHDKDGSGLDKLDEFSKLGVSNPSKFNGVDGEFRIGVRKIHIHSDLYEITTVAEVKGAKSTLVTTINNTEEEITKEPSIKDTEKNKGNGSIFLNNTSKVEIPKLSQFEGEGITLYTSAVKNINTSPIFLEDEDVKSLFVSLNDRKKGNVVKNLNAQTTVKNYSLKITNPQDINSSISTTNPIKIDRLVNQKSKHKIEKDKSFKEIEFRYSTTKQELLNYFSNGSFKTNTMTDSQIEKELKNIFLIPIRTLKEYKLYISEGDLYPPSPKYEITKDSKEYITINDLTTSKPLSKSRIINIPKEKNVLFEGGIHLTGGGNLTLKTEGDCNIKLNDSLRMEDDGESDIIIQSSGIVNFYIDKDIQINRKIIAIGEGEVNFYMSGNEKYNGPKFIMNNGAIIQNVNLYAPYADVQLQNDIIYEGIIVAGKFQMLDTSTFKTSEKLPIDNPDSNESASEDKIVKKNGLIINWNNLSVEGN